MTNKCKRDIKRCKICKIPVIFNDKEVNPHKIYHVQKEDVYICADCTKYFIKIRQQTTTTENITVTFD